MGNLGWMRGENLAASEAKAIQGAVRSHKLEIGASLVCLVSVCLSWYVMVPGELQAAIHPASPETRELAALEDAFARDRGDLSSARALADRYLRLKRPQLAIAIVRAAEPELLQDPGLSHHLARAYEASGRVLDALTTAHLAYARCARVLGSSDASTVTPVPAYGCSERELASLRVHREALIHMAQWGVQHPDRDHRTQMAYQLAQRRVRVASSGTLPE
jgi:hypothetical protein